MISERFPNSSEQTLLHKIRLPLQSQVRLHNLESLRGKLARRSCFPAPVCLRTASTSLGILYHRSLSCPRLWGPWRRGPPLDIFILRIFHRPRHSVHVQERFADWTKSLQYIGFILNISAGSYNKLLLIFSTVLFPFVLLILEQFCICAFGGVHMWVVCVCVFVSTYVRRSEVGTLYAIFRGWVPHWPWR